MSERRREFQRQLDAIEGKVIELFAVIGADLPGATKALLTGSNEMAGLLAEREKVISAIYPELEDLVNKEILLESPVASDLRFLLSVSRIVPEIELSRSLVVQIAARADHILSEDLSPRCRGLIERMGSLVADMWRRTADAWYRRDNSVAAILSERNEELGELHASLVGELASGSMSLPVTMEMTLVGRFYTRLGDHAVNIARRIIYLAGAHPPQPQD
jgi:phosphate transport system protein